MKDIQRLKELYVQYREKKCTPEEIELFFDLLAQLSFDNNCQDSFAGKPMLQVTTSTGEYREFVLSDGSMVRLAPQSKLLYAEIFKGYRRFVQLEGRADFNVMPSKEYPFVIKIAEVHIQTNGGSIEVSAYEEDPDIDILILEGKASVHLESIAYKRKLYGSSGWQIQVNKMRQQLSKGYLDSIHKLN